MANGPEVIPTVPWAEAFENVPAFGDEEFSWEGQDETVENLSSDAQSLVLFGKLEEEFWLGPHRVRMRTLTVDEELAVDLIIKPWNETKGEGRAYVTAVVGAALVAENGRDFFSAMPLGPDDTSVERVIRQKFEFTARRYYWPVLQRLYDFYKELERRQLAALDELAKKSPTASQSRN